jgi:hypothetical protein
MGFPTLGSELGEATQDEFFALQLEASRPAYGG